jgi:hypothetical protein
MGLLAPSSSKDETSEDGWMTDSDDIDRAVEIERLAALDPLDYEVARGEAAKRLKMRASVLDRVVAAKRAELGLDTDEEGDKGQGRAVKIDDVLPWPEPVSGDQIATTLEAAIKTYAVLAYAAVDAIVLWVLHGEIVHNLAPAGRHLADQGLRQNNDFAFVEQTGAAPETRRQYFAAGPVPRRRTVSADDIA